MTTWMTTPLTTPPGTVHWVAHLTREPRNGLHPTVCDPLSSMQNARPAKTPHGYCIGCLAATAESPDWCVTDLHILRQVAEPWVLSRLITDPDEAAKQLVARTAGASSHGSGWAWCQDGLRIWADKQPGAAVLDKHTPDRVLAWTDLRAHAAAHSTAEQTWWLHELTAWERHWWTEGLAAHQTGDKETGWTHGHRHRRAQNYAHAIAHPTWADETLANTPPATDRAATASPRATAAAPRPEPEQLDLLDYLETT